ncbi:MAG: hypothetical protein ACOC5D_00090 [Thermoplasmatota archaeon]
MCKYKYGNDKCAHPKNIALECVGEDKCQYVEETSESFSNVESRTNFESKEFDLDSYDQNEVQDDTCPMTECGLYCKKYNRFYCAGKDNCEDEEEYMKHMKEFGGIDIEKEFSEK